MCPLWKQSGVTLHRMGKVTLQTRMGECLNLWSASESRNHSGKRGCFLSNRQPSQEILGSNWRPVSGRARRGKKETNSWLWSQLSCHVRRHLDKRLSSSSSFFRPSIKCLDRGDELMCKRREGWVGACALDWSATSSIAWCPELCQRRTLKALSF